MDFFADYFSALRYDSLVSAEQIELQRPVMAWIGGRPVYADEVRQLADVVTEYQPHSWKPANYAAQKLFRCVECLRDMEVLLQTAGRLKNKTKQRRKLKIIHTPLYSLVEAIRDLANDLENNPDTVCQLPNGARQLVPQLRSQLLLISTVEKVDYCQRHETRFLHTLTESFRRKKCRFFWAKPIHLKSACGCTHALLCCRTLSNCQSISGLASQTVMVL
jgi:hypothetical protein